MTNDVRTEIPQVTVVLTAGRSGSSLVMEMLAELGLGLSDELIAGRLENPHGFFEDRAIVDIHKGLLEDLEYRAGFPLPEGWRSHASVRRARRALESHLRKQVESAGPRGVAVKDPRISELLPLWISVLNRANVVPRFILAVRHPVAYANSLARLLNREQGLSELQWLQRTISSIEGTGADCFIVHYENWFECPLEQAADLAHYCRIPDASRERLAEVISATVDSNLDHAGWRDESPQNPVVREFYQVLKDSQGANFDRARLLGAAREATHVLEAFRPWADAGATAQARITHERTEHETQLHHLRQELHDAHEHLATTDARLTLERTNHQAQLHDLQQQLHDVRDPLQAEISRMQEALANSVAEGQLTLQALHELDRTHEHFRTQASAREAELRERARIAEEQLTEVLAANTELRSSLNSCRASNSDYAYALDTQASELQALRQLLHAIFDSKMWRLANRWRRLKGV